MKKGVGTAQTKILINLTTQAAFKKMPDVEDDKTVILEKSFENGEPQPAISSSEQQTSGEEDDNLEEGIYDIEDVPDTEYIELPNGLMGTRTGKILVPESMKAEVLKRFHDDRLAGHLGTRKTIVRIKRSFIWKSMIKEIKEVEVGSRR